MDMNSAKSGDFWLLKVRVIFTLLLCSGLLVLCYIKNLDKKIRVCVPFFYMINESRRRSSMMWVQSSPIA